MLKRTPIAIALSAGAALVSSGTVVFSNSNGVSFGLNGQTVTASAAGGFSAGVSTGGNTQGNTGLVGSQLVFVGNNNITLSGSTNGGSATISISGGAGAAGNTGYISAGGATASLGTIVYSNSNGVSFGVNGQTITATVATNYQSQGAYLTTAALSQDSSKYAGTNGAITGGSITVNTSGVSVNLPAYLTTAAMSQDSSKYAGTNGAITGGSITVNTSGVSINLPAYLTTAMQSNAATISNIRVSAGTTSNLLSALTFGNSNGLSFGLDASTITGSYTVPSVAGLISAVNFSAGTASSNRTNVTFADSNGVSFGLNTNGVVTATVKTDYLTTADLSQNSSKYVQEWALTGNTAGTTSSAQGTRLYLSGGNSLTVSGNSNTIVFSVGAYLTTAMQSNAVTLSNIKVSAGTASNLLSAVTFADSNGLAFGLNGSTITGSYTVPNVPAQTNQTVGLYGLGNTTQNSSTTLDARTLSFNGLGGMTIGYSNGSIQLSAPQTAAQTVQTIGLYAVGNTTQNSSTTLDARTLSFDGLGAATVGYSNGSVQVSVPVQTVESQSFGMSNLGNTSGTTGIASGGQVRALFAGGNNITISQSVNGASATLTISAFNQTNQTVGLFANSNTTQSSTGTQDARSITFAGAGIASVGVSNGSVVISVPAGGGAGGIFAGVSNLGNTAGSTGTVSTGNFVFVGTNALTLSQSTGGAGSAATITFSVPATSSLSATGWASIVTNGSTISIGATTTMNLYAVGNTFGTSSGTADLRTISISGASGIQVAASNSGWVIGNKLASFFEPFPGEAKVTASVSPGSVSQAVQFCLPYAISASFLRLPIFLTTNSTTLSTAAASMSGSATVATTYNAVVYSLGTGASSQSLISVASGSAAWGMLNSISVLANGTNASYTQSLVGAVEGAAFTSSTQYSISNTNYSFTTNQIFTNFSGTRFLDVNFANSLTPGPYWLIWGMTTSSNSNSARVSAATNCNIGYSGHYGDTASNVAFGIMGSTNLSSGNMIGAGSFSTVGGGTTSILPISAITSSASHFRPYFQMARSA